jgi:class 3 adenylate cyclase
MSGSGALSLLAPRQAGERRLVSVLFTDMVGYTATVERLGEENAVPFTRMTYDLLVGVVHAHGGVVRGFAGDSIMAVFGMAEGLEDAGLRACRAGLAVHAAFRDAADRFQAGFGVRPVMRVGISSGAVVVAAVEGDGAQTTAVGNTVNLASRIQSLAQPGGVLLCDTTRQLVEWLVELRFHGEHMVKGVARPQKLWQLHEIRESATRFDASLARGLSQYVGRNRELALLEAEMAQSRTGLRVVDLVAEPGLGKTRLVFELLHSDHAADFTLLSGHCMATGQLVPLLPFLEVVRTSFGIHSQDDHRLVSAKLQEGLQRLGLDTPEALGLLMNSLGLPPADGVLDGMDGVLRGLRTRDLLHTLIKSLCASRPVALLIEDIHWIDDASAEILQRLIAEGGFPNLFVLHTRRPEHVPGWLGLPGVTTLPLTPLDGEDIRNLAATRLGVASLPDELVRQIVERAGGNPLFGEELLNFLLEQGALTIEDGRAAFDSSKGESALPVSMQSLLEARMKQLPAPDRALLQAAAAIGRRFDLELLSALVGDPDAVAAALQRMHALDIIYRDGSTSHYMFKHALLRDAVYNSLVAERRSDLHAAIADGIEARNADRLVEVAETLAYHAARSAQADKAFRYNVLAGIKSLGIFSHSDAARYFADALGLYEADPGIAGDDELVALLAQYALCLNISLDVKTMIGLVERVGPFLAQAADSSDHVLFLHHYVSCLVANSRFHDALAVQKQLTAMARRVGDPKSIAYALVNELSVSTYCPRPAPLSNAEFAARKAEIDAALTRFDDAYLQNFYFAMLGWNELTRGRVEGARQAAEQLVLHGAQRNDARALGYGTAMKALVSVVTDDHQSALMLAEEARQLARAEFEIAIAESTRVGAMVPCGTPGAVEAVNDYLARCEASGCRIFAGVPQTMLGLAYAMNGRITDGLRQIEATIEAREAEGMEIAADWNRLFLGEVYLQILSGEGDASLGVLLRNFGSLAGVMFSGERRILALIERVRANPHWDEDGYFHARCDMILGLLHKLRKRKPQAIAHLGKARAAIAPVGASPMLARIEQALAELQG